MVPSPWPMITAVLRLETIGSDALWFVGAINRLNPAGRDEVPDVKDAETELRPAQDDPALDRQSARVVRLVRKHIQGAEHGSELRQQTLDDQADRATRGGGRRGVRREADDRTEVHLSGQRRADR